MTRHQIVIEVDSSLINLPVRKTPYGLMLDLADEAENRGWVLTNVSVREVTDD